MPGVSLQASAGNRDRFYLLLLPAAPSSLYPVKFGLEMPGLSSVLRIGRYQSDLSGLEKAGSPD